LRKKAPAFRAEAFKNLLSGSWLFQDTFQLDFKAGFSGIRFFLDIEFKRS
jgi:hypothetical protein